MLKPIAPLFVIEPEEVQENPNGFQSTEGKLSGKAKILAVPEDETFYQVGDIAVINTLYPLKIVVGNEKEVIYIIGKEDMYGKWED